MTGSNARQGSSNARQTGKRLLVLFDPPHLLDILEPYRSVDGGACTMLKAGFVGDGGGRYARDVNVRWLVTATPLSIPLLQISCIS